MAKKKSPGLKASEENQIVYPKKIGPKRAADHLLRFHESQEEQVQIHHVFDKVWPYELAYAAHLAIEKLYGWAIGKGQESPFGKLPSQMLGIKTSYDESVQLIWGEFTCPGFDPEDSLRLTSFSNSDGPSSSIDGRVKKKNEEEVNIFVATVREFLLSDNLYQGKVIKVNFEFTWNYDEDFDMEGHAPRFMAPTGVTPESLIFNEDTLAELNRAVFTPIKFPDACKKVGISLKQGILLSGGYGCGKTLTASAVATLAPQYGWTVFICEDTRDLEPTLKMAARYPRSIVFAEDIDRLISGGSDYHRTPEMDRILNTLDGVELKSCDIMTIMTTNAVQEIHPGMMRPGRIDTLIPIVKPDPLSCQRLVQLYAGDLLSPDSNLEEAGEALASVGMIPASIKAIVEQAKLACVGRTGGEIESLEGSVTAEDILTATTGMVAHMEYCQPKLPDKRSDIEKAADRVAAGMSRCVTMLQDQKVEDFLA